jgi:hypothetical protein
VDGVGFWGGIRGFFERRGREGCAEIAEKDRKEYKNKILKIKAII